MLESSGIRGSLVRLGPVAETILGRHGYPEPVAGLLGEVLALTGMLSALLKYDGVFTLQTKGDGPVGMMVADITSEGALRGYAGFDGESLEAVPEDAARKAPGRVREFLGGGHLAFTVDQGAFTERYQGIVELQGESLADCLQHYFRQSEQIQTGLMAAAGRVGGVWRAGGLILQRTPEDGQAAEGEADWVVEEDWRRAMILQASCTAGELLDPDLSAHDLLFRLFHEEGVRVFKRRKLSAECRCTRERLEQTLRAMPRGEVEDLKIEGEVRVTCQFCNKDYNFDAAALERIYAP